MFKGKLKKHSKIVWNWYESERDLPVPSARTLYSLKWYTKHFGPFYDYGYEGDWKNHLEYACDRMNGGRAKAILRLLKEVE